MKNGAYHPNFWNEFFIFEDETVLYCFIRKESIILRTNVSLSLDSHF